MSIYQPLPDDDDRSYLRLLKLQPGDTQDDIECELEVATYEDSKHCYEAISYCWGDAKDTVPIVCHGVHVNVTRNLCDALRRFRTLPGTSARLLWADALCINQKDNEEKGKQVGRMGEVYANASRVLVWLGGDIDDDMAISTCAMICDICQHLDRVFLQYESMVSMPALSETDPICLEESKWHGVTAMLRSPWFGRVWTLQVDCSTCLSSKLCNLTHEQEAALAKRCSMFWGVAEIDAADVTEFCLWCSFKHDLRRIINSFANVPNSALVNKNFYAYVHYKSLASRSKTWFTDRPLSAHRAETEKPGQWTSLLEEANHLEATDPRDYIYAFLGCPAATSSYNRPYLQADYTISIEQLYCHLADVLLRQSSEGPWCLGVMCQERDDLMRSSIPSWVTPWSSHSQVSGITYPGHWYRAGGPEHFYQTAKQDEGTLAIRGSLFDKVEWMSDILVAKSFRIAQAQYAQVSQSNTVPYIDRLWDLISRNMAESGIELQLDDFFSMLMQGFPGGGPSRESWHLRVLNAYLKAVHSKLATGISEGNHEREQYEADYVEDVLLRRTNHRIVVTQKRRIGLVPAPPTRIGDTLCIFHGVSVPFVLAPTTEGRFKLATQAYIHGVMAGELVDQFEAEDILLE
jgi:hypothetical protein